MLGVTRSAWGSTPGKRDGLFWADASRASRLARSAISWPRPGPRAIHAAKDGGRIPVSRVLLPHPARRGPQPPGGAYDYVAQGHMIGGFALVAFPADYGASGMMTFIVNHDGVVYQKDLGVNTARLAESMKRYDPDATWQKVDAVALKP